MSACLVAGTGTATGIAAEPAAGDSERGRRVYQKGYACHSVVPGEHGLPGPNLHGVVGRRAGTLEGFRFLGRR